ncbi:sucrase ferredoxin [Halomonas sp. ML-15]|uniref:sucrase ferredoxin n=1 Tax=Halomonas sp. ML-15 TaxID=2773305 RepID=UPI0017477A8A|nr:sucrase ferredoxin [Halomonas sp. ML-15]MBD3894914.1 sucrase ferredoxin [Halomonas sp. ML-15]
MTAPHRFCAQESLAQGDPLAGSAAHAERNLLLSWPRPKWQRSLRQASDMSAEVSTRLEAVAEAGRRVNLIHRRDQPSESHCLYLMPENLRYEVSRDELPDLLAALQRDEPLAHWERAAPAVPLLLCCTHGKKDKCCAKFGYAAYKALGAAVAERDLPFEVWESTHLGGCRLAASAVVFPTLRKYGRIGEEDVLPLLESEMADRPYLPCYRGDSRLSPVQQCAQVAALEWLAERSLYPSVSVSPPSDPEASRSRLIAEWQTATDQGTLAVECVQRILQRFDTCADLDAPAKATWVWQAVSLQQLEPHTLLRKPYPHHA